MRCLLPIFVVNRHHQMERQLTVLVLYESWHVGVRLIRRLSEVRNLKVLIGLGVTGKSVEFVSELKPHVVVIDAQLSHASGIEVLR